MRFRPEQPMVEGTEDVSAPLIAHVVYRFDVGGMENGIVNLINAMPARYRHAVIALTECTEFRRRVQRPDVLYYAVGKRPGKDPVVYWKLWRLLRQLQPQILHTRNLPALDAILPGALARVPVRVHGEHGREIIDIDGTHPRYLRLRRWLQPLTHRYIALSSDLAQWLRDRVGVPSEKITQIYNGVDSERFRPSSGGRGALPRPGFCGPDDIVIGTVGRMQAVKDQLTLARAFVRLLELLPEQRARLRLVCIGDGPLRAACENLVAAAGAAEQAWFAGTRDDIPALMRGFDVFVLPSLAEGISNTILEAMATGLPVVATRVGGNAELVRDDVTGRLVPPANTEALARALARYVQDPGSRSRHGGAGRERVEREFSLSAMVERYTAVYDQLFRERVVRAAG